MVQKAVSAFCIYGSRTAAEIVVVLQLLQYTLLLLLLSCNGLGRE